MLCIDIQNALLLLQYKQILAFAPKIFCLFRRFREKAFISLIRDIVFLYEVPDIHFLCPDSLYETFPFFFFHKKIPLDNYSSSPGFFKNKDRPDLSPRRSALFKSHSMWLIPLPPVM